MLIISSYYVGPVHHYFCMLVCLQLQVKLRLMGMVLNDVLRLGWIIPPHDVNTPICLNFYLLFVYLLYGLVCTATTHHVLLHYIQLEDTSHNFIPAYFVYMRRTLPVF